MPSGLEQRRHSRHDTLQAVMVTPNGDQHAARVMNLSLGGARMSLPEHWLPDDGAALRVYFRVDSDEFALTGHVTRVTIDHLGIAFDPAQDERIESLFAALGLGVRD